MSNAFDMALSGDVGLLKKIKKAVSSVGKAVEKTAKQVVGVVRDVKSEVAQKTLPSAVRDLGRELDDKGITKLAAGVALTVLAAGAGAGVLAATAAAVGTKALTDSAARDNADYQLAKAEDRLMQEIAAEEAAAVEQLALAVGEMPEFAAVIKSLRAQGYTDAEIAAHWASSKAYYETALAATEQVVGPVVAVEAAAAGVPPEQFEAVVGNVTRQVSAAGVRSVQAQAGASPAGSGSGSALGVLGIIAAAAVLLL